VKKIQKPKRPIEPARPVKPEFVKPDKINQVYLRKLVEHDYYGMNDDFEISLSLEGIFTDVQKELDTKGIKVSLKDIHLVHSIFYDTSDYELSVKIDTFIQVSLPYSKEEYSDILKVAKEKHKSEISIYKDKMIEYEELYEDYLCRARVYNKQMEEYINQYLERSKLLDRKPSKIDAFRKEIIEL
jgi:hypothetical protein